MAKTAAARFDTTLKDQGLQLEERDRAAALRVFASLERACERLKSEETDGDEPR